MLQQMRGGFGVGRSIRNQLHIRSGYAIPYGSYMYNMYMYI